MAGISTILFDLDGTLVRYQGILFESSWGAIADAAGVSDRSAALLKEYLHRHEAYADWVMKDSALLRGVSVREVADRVLPAPYAAGVREAVAELRGRYRLGILSSGVDLVADWVCQDLGMEFAVANRVHIENGLFTGTSETVVDLWAKDQALIAIADRLGLNLQEVCFVGDHVNDIPAMRIVGLAIAANPKDDSLASVAHYTISDFSELPPLVDGWQREGAAARP